MGILKEVKGNGFGRCEGVLQHQGASGRGRRRSGASVIEAGKLVPARPAAVDVVDGDDFL